MASQLKPPILYGEDAKCEKKASYPWNHKSIIMTNLLAFYFFELAML